jgi:O-acetyl-ADP-ribose deacetylase (regulator of RNase III)
MDNTRLRIGSTVVSAKLGDITQEVVDVIVCPIRDPLGIDEMLFRVGGEQLLADYERTVKPGLPLALGLAKPGAACALRAISVTYTMSNLWIGTQSRFEHDWAFAAHYNCLRLSASQGPRIIAIPALGRERTGNVPIDAARIALETARDFALEHPAYREIRFVLSTESDLAVYQKALDAVKKAEQSGYAAAQRKERNKETVTCPVCGEARPTQLVRDVARHLLEHNVTWLWGYSDRVLEGIRTGEVQWACPECIHLGRALPAEPLGQTFCDHPPYLAYFDVNMHCEDCGCEFVFSAGEQRYWYEELKFWVQSRPKQCAPCRKRRRLKNRLSQEIGQVLAELDPRDPEQLARVAEMYLQMNNRRKGVEFLRRARNVAGQSERYQALMTRLDELEADLLGVEKAPQRDEI